MAKDKKSVLLYCDIIHTVEGLTDEEAGALFKHYLRYINDLNPVSEDRLTALLFEPIKQNLKRDLIKWESKSERNSIIAKEGWVKRKNANASERIKPNAKDAVKDKVTVTVKDKVIDIINKEEKKHPSIEDFINYGLSKGLELNLTIDVTKLKSKYLAWETNNWRTGKDRKITNWKTTLLNTLTYLQEEKKKEGRKTGSAADELRKRREGFISK